jgi:ATP-dependent protease ClpP protease subunit
LKAGGYMKKVYVTGDIDEDAFRLFCEDMDEAESSTPREINVIICSYGGSAEVGLAFYSRLRCSSASITTTVYGPCFSAATLILAAGAERRMAKESWAMLHEDSTSLKNASVQAIEKEGKQLRRFEDQWNKILSERLNIPLTLLEHMHREETYLTAQQCLDINLATEVF